MTNYKIEDNISIFAFKLSNITDYNTKITVKAYVYIGGEKIELKPKEYSVYEMVSEYISRANELDLNSDTIEILSAFKLFIENL